MVLPTEAGVCEPHVGTEFLTTVQVRVAVDEPFVTEATSVLLPTFSELLSDVRKLDVSPTRGEPFNDQEMAQFESLGTMP